MTATILFRKASRTVTLLLVAVVFGTRTASGWTPSSPLRSATRWQLELSSNGNPNDDYAFTKAEVEHMEDLILSLSKEPTDESRRARLTQVFDAALSSSSTAKADELSSSTDPDTLPIDGERFARLFDETVIRVGDQVRQEALEQLASAPPPPPPLAEEETSEQPPALSEKSPQELQVWALVDMMVQSKTIFKRSKGEVGNKGSFA